MFQGKYRVDTARLREWDYSMPGAYFVTICSKDRVHFFGAVVGGSVRLSSIGQAADMWWRAIPDHFTQVTLDEYIVMPNHVHGIIVIGQPHTSPSAETRHGASQSPGGSQFGPLKFGSLPTIVNAYKGAVTRWCRNNAFPDFGWQARYWDHVVRDEVDLNRIRQYIADNPARWEAETDAPASVWM